MSYPGELRNLMNELDGTRNWLGLRFGGDALIVGHVTQVLTSGDARRMRLLADYLHELYPQLCDGLAF